MESNDAKKADVSLALEPMAVEPMAVLSVDSSVLDAARAIK